MSRITARVFRAASNGAWLASKAINGLFPEANLPSPSWAPGRLLKQRNRRLMDTGVPRKTLSLCPDCNREAVEALLKGEIDAADFRDNPGIIEAEILEEGGRILMRKACEQHGPFEDTLSNHPDFFRKMERLAFGRDFECVDDCKVHGHGPNSLRSGRGTFLIVDITNRCNMMCSPCFMDANAASYVHELTIEDIKTIFSNALSFKPQREINVLFSGGEPTVSPIFLDAVRHAKSMGFHRLHVATNGVHFAESRDFAFRAKEAGLHAVYLQLDGVSEEKNKHRGLGNYIAVKRQALENIASAGMRTTLQVTVTNGVNDDGLGDIVRFGIQNIDKIHGVVFQPIMFAGRDEGVSADERYAHRYPLTQLAFDLHEQTSIGWQPMRDWFPLSDFGIFAHLCDVLNPQAKLGSLFQETHPNRGIFSPLLVDTHQKHAIPIPVFFNLEQFMRDVVEITDSARGPAVTKAHVSLSALRNFNQQKAPSGFGPADLRRVLEDCFYRVAGSCDHWSQKVHSYGGRWRVMILNGMWFQDAFNYDFSGICNSTTPVATTQGEISFCAYYGGGWRKVVEHQSRTATLAEWHRTHGRHEIYANGKKVDLGQPVHGADTELIQIDAQPLAIPTSN
ncbi:MAG TPA: radical SAM protein [Candidatus Polarisedimenticolia bacterium]|nr:radical SAM protein [Candidatus Polarisedimenticolia bacterium]